MKRTMRKAFIFIGRSLLTILSAIYLLVAGTLLIPVMIVGVIIDSIFRTYMVMWVVDTVLLAPYTLWKKYHN